MHTLWKRVSLRGKGPLKDLEVRIARPGADVVSRVCPVIYLYTHRLLPACLPACHRLALVLGSGTWRITQPLITSTEGQEGLSLRAENSAVFSPSCCWVLLLGEAAGVVMRPPAKEAALVSRKEA